MDASPPQAIVSFGEKARRGNLVAIQPYMMPKDYASASAFQAKLESYFMAARRQGWLSPHSVVVLPEHIGTWLVAAAEFPLIYRVATVQAAMPILILGRPLSFLKAYLLAWGGRRHVDALFRMKGRHSARVYQLVFSTLARRYTVTVVAGSIVLPGPRIINGKLATSASGALYNISTVFRPNGKLYPHFVRKVFPITAELGFTAPGMVSELPVFDTPIGRLGVLICADSWQPVTYQHLAEQGAELLAVPCFLSGDRSWQQPWAGYQGAAPPNDVEPSDVGRLSEGEAWLKYGLPGRFSKHGIRHAMAVFLRGHLWDLGSDGHTLLLHDGQLQEAPAVDGAALANLWL
jgi:predicted amidohydrolase